MSRKHPTVQEPVKEVEKVSISLDEDQKKGLDRLTMALEKALTSEFDNKVKGELISRYFSRFESRGFRYPPL